MGTFNTLFSIIIVSQIIIIFSIISLGVETHGKSFGILFLIMWGGSFVVTINTKLLGGHISFFQCVCVLGYCVFPVVLAAAVIYLLKILTINFLILKIAICGAAVVWSSLSKYFVILTNLFRLPIFYECND
jgi:hypothetical protein